MSEKDTSKNENALWPFWSLWQVMMDRMSCRPGATVPGIFEQPILPGWTFGSVINVTKRNSSAPDTERDIVAAHSYGRQLGRVIEALAVLIKERSESRPDTALIQLLELHEKFKTSNPWRWRIASNA